jgi:hypothetical protein
MADPDKHAMTSQFWFKHRDRFTIKDSPLEFQPAYGNLLDYSHAEVRGLRLDTVAEVLARNRDLVDGFELDFNRFQVFFPKGKAATGAPLLTELVREVRRRLDLMAAELGRPLWLFVRVPPSTADCAFAGIEIERWMRDGLVDLVSPAQIMTLAGDMPIADLVALGRETGVRVAPSLYPRTSWRLPFPAAPAAVENRYAGAMVSREATLEEIRGAAAQYCQLGVDGFYLFNFYNAFGSARPHDERLYRVCRDLARPEALAGQAKVFAVTKSYYNDGPNSYAYGKQLPAPLARDGTLRVTLRIADEPSATPFPLAICELRLGFRDLAPGAKLALSVDGRPLADEAAGALARIRVAAVTGRPTRQPDLAETYVHVPLTAALPAGERVFTVAVTGVERPLLLTDFEVRHAYRNELEPLWQRVPAKLNAAPAPRR